MRELFLFKSWHNNNLAIFSVGAIFYPPHELHLVAFCLSTLIMLCNMCTRSFRMLPFSSRRTKARIHYVWVLLIVRGSFFFVCLLRVSWQYVLAILYGKGCTWCFRGPVTLFFYKFQNFDTRTVYPPFVAWLHRTDFDGVVSYAHYYHTTTVVWPINFSDTTMMEALSYLSVV